MLDAVFDCEPLFQVYAYFLLAGMVHAALAAAGLVLALPLVFFRHHAYVVFARGFVVFNVLLLICGCAANLLWDRFVFGTVYVSMDYVFDFTPFWPLSQRHIDMKWGDVSGEIYHGMGMAHVRALWAAFSFAAWMGTIFLYSRIRRLWLGAEGETA